MGFLTLLEVASMPIFQVFIVSGLGAFMATDYLNLLPLDTRKSLNRIVFTVFTPSLMFSSLAETVTFEDIISWWFMPVNIGITFVIGSIFGWIAVKILKPKPHLEGLIIATCSAGNLGNLLLIIVPAICKEDGSPFGDHGVCSSVGLSYASFSMALGGIYLWTYTYQLVQSSSVRYKALKANAEALKEPNKNSDTNEKSPLLGAVADHVAIVVSAAKGTEEDKENQTLVSQGSCEQKEENASFWRKLIVILHHILEELSTPPTLGAIAGFIFGAISWLKNLVIGDNAPLKVIQDSVKLLGDGTIPCITLILGGNLTQGLRKAKIKPLIIIAIVCIRYIILPVIGIGVVRAASHLGFLPSDPLFHFVLMLHYTVPPAMSIGTMAQLFDVGQDECSILFLWTYLVAALALTIWSTIFMWLLIST